MCARCYTPVKPGVPWERHTPQVCYQAKEIAQKSEQVDRCTKHPPVESGCPPPPRLLLGKICPKCSPKTSVRCIDPNVLRNISKTGRAPTVLIYRIGPNSEVCNLIDPTRCPNNACTCKNRPETSTESIALRQFWLTYTARVKNSFDHNLPPEPLQNSSPDPDEPARRDEEEEEEEGRADPREADVDSDDECYDAQTLVQCYKMREADFFAYAIANPPETVKPQVFLREYLDEIMHFMKTSETLRNREDESFKMWIWAHVTFVDVDMTGGNTNRDLINKKNQHV